MADDLDLPDFLKRAKGEPKAEAHADRAHARLAPSASHRWMECPGSIALSDGIEGTSSSFANEGTAAHELAGHCLKMGFDADRFADHVIDITAQAPPAMFLANPSAHDGDKKWLVDEEMIESVQLYIDHVRGLLPRDRKGAELDVEQRLDMTHVHRDIFGTGDATVFIEETGHLHVCDLKYGKGVVVEVADNPQLMLYGAGAVQRYQNRDLRQITLWVVQPRAPHPDGPVRSFDVNPLELMEWEDDLSAAATEVDEATTGRFQNDKPVAGWDETFLKAGDWCKFCPALPSCPAARNKATNTALSEFADGPDDVKHLAPPSSMSSDELANVLAEADFIGTWVKSVQEYAHAEAVAGRTPSGYKLVAKRAMRKWNDEETAEETLVLEHGLMKEDLYAEPKFKSPAQVEKLTGKKAFKDIEADMVSKVSSGTNLVPVSDKRPAVKAEGLSEFGE